MRGVRFSSLIIFVLALLSCSISVNPLTDLKQIVERRPTPFVPRGLPVEGRFSSRFGLRWHPIGHQRQFHQGLDIASERSSPVKATASGKVKWAGWKGGYGRCVIIDHGHGWETLYAHLKSHWHPPGSFVESGETIGKVGSSGFVTGPHLHYEVRYLGQPQDPIYFIGGLNRPMFSRLENSYRRVSFRRD